MQINHKTLLDITDILAQLAKSIATAGSQAKWCAEQGVSPAYVSDVLNGRRDPGKKILDALGYDAVTCYRPKN